MTEITIPAHGWKPRSHQQAAWDYLQKGGRHAELIWHRRYGKDEIAMQFACISMLERAGTYWHMLPLHTQVRKAIWMAVNPRTGRRRIDDVFPDEIFTKNESEMIVKSKINASTWQCMGSDNFQGAIGSPPVGIVYSEWAQANPLAAGYLRPIIRENNGWQIFITTPRGKNHAHKTYNAAKKNKNSFAQTLTIHDTQALSPEELLEELGFYADTYGDDYGLALFEQEYECSFDAAIIGAYYSAEFKKIDRDGRICNVPHDPDWPVHVAMDIGFHDDLSIWWYQVVHGQYRIIEHYTTNSKTPDEICGLLLGVGIAINLIGDPHEQTTDIKVVYGELIKGLEYRNKYNYGSINLPHDGAAITFVAKGKTVQEQFAAVFGWGKVIIVPKLSIQDGIQASRKLLSRCEIDSDIDLEAMRQYQRKWDEKKAKFDEKPLHNWCSHPADGFRYMAISITHDTIPKDIIEPKYELDQTFNQMVKDARKKRLKNE